MDVKKIRREFPLIEENSRHKQYIYFDNACQSLRPRSVIDAITTYYRDWSACGGRSNHQLSTEVTNRVAAARQSLAKLINATKEEEIIFTRNTTEGINLVANSLDLKPGDVVLISDKEHNSNLIPWQMAAKNRGVVLKIIPSAADETFSILNYEALLDDRVKLVSLGWTSNLDGVSLPVPEIIKKAHQNGARVLLDAAQAAPHQKINVRGLDVDFLAFSGHKMLGPSGTGVLYGKLSLLEKLTPFLVGGDTVASSTYETCEFLPPPEKFEAGLQDYAGMIGLGAAAQFLLKVGFDAIQKQEQMLTYFDGVDSHQVAIMLDQMANIQVRSGQHCVHSWFNSRQIKGSVRASVYFYNTEEEAQTFIGNLKKIRKVF
jgi:cysteine desulfurase/selenocysteine lyase